jgi:hypothetical protein
MAETGFGKMFARIIDSHSKEELLELAFKAGFPVKPVTEQQFSIDVTYRSTLLDRIEQVLEHFEGIWQFDDILHAPSDDIESDAA